MFFFLRKWGGVGTSNTSLFSYNHPKFSLTVYEINLAVFPSKVQILSLSKNITYENFVSVVLLRFR